MRMIEIYYFSLLLLWLLLCLSLRRLIHDHKISFIYVPISIIIVVIATAACHW